MPGCAGHDRDLAATGVAKNCTPRRGRTGDRPKRINEINR